MKKQFYYKSDTFPGRYNINLGPNYVHNMALHSYSDQKINRY